MNQTLRMLFRGVFVVWFALALFCGLSVFWKTSVPSGAALLSFLFTRELPPIVPVLVPMAAQPLEPGGAQEPVVVTPPAEKSGSAPQLPLMERGKRQGQGRLGTPEVQLLTGGAVEVRVPYEGKLGAMSRLSDTSRSYCAVDLHGNWKNVVPKNQHPVGGDAQVVQFGHHDGFYRITASTAPNRVLIEETRYSPTHVVIRFSLDKTGKGA